MYHIILSYYRESIDITKCMCDTHTNDLFLDPHGSGEAPRPRQGDRLSLGNILRYHAHTYITLASTCLLILTHFMYTLQLKYSLFRPYHDITSIFLLLF